MKKIKKKMDLQLFAEAVPGKKIVYLYRVHEDAGTDAGWILGFTTENGRTVSVDADSTATKSGAVRTPGVPEIEITATSLLTKDDTSVDDLEEAMLGSKLIDIWEANLEEAGATTGKYKGRYFQGYLTELEKSSNAEDMVEVSLTFGVNGTGKTGDVTVTSEQIAVADYSFTDTPIKAE